MSNVATKVEVGDEIVFDFWSHEGHRGTIEDIYADGTIVVIDHDAEGVWFDLVPEDEGFWKIH